MRIFQLCFLLFFCLACSENPQHNTSSPPHQNNTQPIEPASGDTLNRSTTRPDTAFQIIPGQRLGQVALRDSPQHVIQTLGDPDARNAAMGKAILTWYGADTAQNRDEVNVYTVRENTGTANETVGVHQVRVTSPQFKIQPSGLSTGSTLEQVRQAFPEAKAVAFYTRPDQQRVYLYDVMAQGITFEVTGPDSLAVAISIHQKGKSVASGYLPVHANLVQLGQQQ